MESLNIVFNPNNTVCLVVCESVGLISLNIVEFSLMQGLVSQLMQHV